MSKVRMCIIHGYIEMISKFGKTVMSIIHGGVLYMDISDIQVGQIIVSVKEGCDWVIRYSQGHEVYCDSTTKNMI